MKGFLFKDASKAAFFNTYKKIFKKSVDTNNIIDIPVEHPEFTIYVPETEQEYSTLKNHDFGFSIKSTSVGKNLPKSKS